MPNRKYIYRGSYRGCNWYFCKDGDGFKMVIAPVNSKGNEQKATNYGGIYVKLLAFQCRKFAMNVININHVKKEETDNGEA